MNGEVSGFLQWDRSTFEALNQWFSGSFFDALMPLLSDFYIWAIPVAIVWLWFFVRADRRGRIIALCAFLVIAATDQLAASVIKPYVQRQRPCNVIPATRLYLDGNWQTTDKFGLTTYKTSYSFPSNHAANIAGQAMYWSYFYPHLTPVFMFAAAVVGWSRIYMGLHYPSDVLVGYLLGAIIALIFAYPLRVWVLPDE
ncbi:phosphatase PAP2 family protein [candidate division KSB1 bacterium]|nr:phosphatase PAP2 family protein [candidate division KSB1 bacterium]